MISPVLLTEHRKYTEPSFCPSRTRPASSIRLIAEFGPRGRTAGRYCGNCAEVGVAEGEPAGGADCEAAGLAEADAAGFVAGEVAGFVGLAAGFTSTSAAKSVSRAIAAAARVNQNLSIECLRNAVLALSQDQFFAPRQSPI